MSPKSVGIVINSEKCPKSETMLTVLKNGFTQLNFNVSNTYINNKIKDAIATFNKSCDILVIVGDFKKISNVLCGIFNEKSVKSNHLASLYNMTEATGPENFYLPENSQIFQIHNCSNGLKPVYVKYRNCFILPHEANSVGIIMEKMMSQMIMKNDVNKESYSKRYVVKCDLNGRGDNVKEELKRLTSLYVTNFCHVKEMSCQLNFVFRGNSFKELFHGDEIVKKMLPENVILDESICDDFWIKFQEIKDKKYVQQALQIISKCYTDYKPEEVFLSFNGGKDCTVLLYLTIYVLKKLHPDFKGKLLCMYIQSENPFKEVEDFIEKCRHFYNLEVATIRNTVKYGLKEILDKNKHLKACLIGTRRTDPYSQNLQHFQMTDQDWPQVMRVSPILDWKYTEIWEFLLKLSIPYCVLYDLGYTSLGSKTNTSPNPALKIISSQNEQDTYLPAFKLEDETKERSGRFKL